MSDKKKLKMGQIFVAFSEYLNFKYSGFANGAPCEASQASGYTVVSSIKAYFLLY